MALQNFGHIDKLITNPTIYGNLIVNSSPSEMPRLLTQNAENPSYFLGRESDLDAIQRAFAEKLQPLFLVNGFRYCLRLQFLLRPCKTCFNLRIPMLLKKI
jgi:hypothetical protein